jgi:hypothetical protein
VAVGTEAIAGKNRRAIVTDWIEGRRTLARTGAPTPITLSIFATATEITAKDSAEVILMAIVNMPVTEDGTKLIALRSCKTEN